MGYVDRIIAHKKPTPKAILLERMILNEIPCIEKDEDAAVRPYL